MKDRKRLITPKALRHDLKEVRRELAELKAEEAWLEQALQRATGDKPQKASNGVQDYEAALLAHLSPTLPQKVQELADATGMSWNAATTHLKALEAKGKARCTNPEMQRNRRWVRREVRVVPGVGEVNGSGSKATTPGGPGAKVAPGTS